MFHMESTNAWDKVLSDMVLLGGHISSQFSLKVKKLKRAYRISSPIKFSADEALASPIERP